ncbi:hypothetical protein GCM10023160_31840 [Brachybacterium paraconglomeratum]|uniref:hypothetical protein n=1 Tax=Brachybacterium paraconglomeratum TaxID=173362 RepID=UPI0031EF4A62
MTELIATVEHASQWAHRRRVPEASWNPVYRALAGGTAPTRLPASSELTDDADLELVLAQLTTPALLSVAVTDGEQTHRLRIGLDAVAATVEEAAADLPSRWSELSTPEVPARIIRLLEDSGVDLAPAELSIKHGANALRLSPAQSRIAYTALTQGVSPEGAFAAIPDLDDTLRDALTATGPRISLALTLHDPRGRVTERPVTWSRLWVTGTNGLYRLDLPARPAPAVHRVGGGDVLGTLLPVLAQGIRFAAACAAAGGAR